MTDEISLSPCNIDVAEQGLHIDQIMTSFQLAIFSFDGWGCHLRIYIKSIEICVYVYIKSIEIYAYYIYIKSIEICVYMYTSSLYAVKVKRHNVVRGGPLSWIPGMWFTQCKFRL